MDQYLSEQDPRIKYINQTLRNCIELFACLGFKKGLSRPDFPGRQIIFENQIIGEDAAFQLTVVYLNIPDAQTMTYNFGYHLLPERSSLVKLQNRQIKDVKIQLIEAKDFHQLTLQIYFLEPLNYSMEDLIYRIRTEKTDQGVKIKSGYPWLTPERHLSDEAAKEITDLIKLSTDLTKEAN